MKAQKINSSGSLITSTSSVTLGDPVWIGVKSTDTALGTNFYLSDCTATNGEDKFEADGTTSNPTYKELPLVKGGCMSKLDASLSTDIAAATGTEGDAQYLSFNQFAFADSSQSKISFLILIQCRYIKSLTLFKAHSHLDSQ